MTYKIAKILSRFCYELRDHHKRVNPAMIAIHLLPMNQVFSLDFSFFPSIKFFIARFFVLQGQSSVIMTSNCDHS